jgi:hypothetical protein
MAARQARHKNRRCRDAAGEAREAGDVVGMLVRDQNGVDAGGLFADGREAFRQLLEAEAGVYQHARFFRGNQRTVAGTTAREHAEFDDGRFSRCTARTAPMHSNSFL